MPRAARNPSDRARRGAAPAASNVRALRARGRDTRRRLLDAATETFATKGYHATRVDDIVKLAATSHGTFYLYFANKEELLRALAGEVADALQAVAETLAPLRPGAVGRAELREWIERFAELYDAHGPVIRTWTQAEMGGSEFGRLGTDVLTQLTRVILRRVSEVAPPGLDPLVASLAIVAMVERLNFYVLTRQVPMAQPAMIDTLARVTHASLFGPDA